MSEKVKKIDYIFGVIRIVVERLSTDIEWLVEIHCSSDDRSGSTIDRFIIITEDFIIFSKVSLCIYISTLFYIYFRQFPQYIDRFVMNFGFVYICRHIYRK